MPEKASKDGAEKKRTDSTIDRRDYLKMASGAGATLGSGLGVGALGTRFTSPARAASTVVDDFGDTDLSGRYVFDSRGATTSVTSVSSAVTSGADTNVLQMEGDGNTRMHAYEGDSDTDLNAYPEIGETFSCWMRGLNGTENMNFMYGAQDKDNKYYVKINLETGDVGLFKYVSGSGQSLAGDWGNSTVQNNTSWFKVEIEWKTDHSHTVTVYQNGSQVGSLSYTEDSDDPQFTATGVGYSAYLSSGETAQYDYATTTGSGGSSGSGSSVIDSFEDGNLSEYEHDTSRPGQASVVSDPSYNGSNALAISDETAELISTSGLDAYPIPGDTFSYWVRGSGGADLTNFRYGVQNHNDGYFVRVNIADDKLKLYLLENGSTVLLDRQVSGFTLSQDTWYEIEIEWGTDGIHTVTLSDRSGTMLAQISESDSTWSSGGIGFDAYLSTGQSVYFDYVALSESRLLGSFESDLDGWTATGSNSLSRVDGSQQPAAVTEGSHALDVTVNSDSEPSIENQQLVQNADFENNYCLLTDVLPMMVENSDSPVTFRFRYHHSDPGGVEESPEHTVNQRYGGRICWDMGGLSETKLANPDRLEIVWYPENHPPSSGFDYNGRVLVDNVRLTDNQNKMTQARKIRKDRELERVHGPIVNQIIDSENETVQDGVYKFYDGTEISYHIEDHQNGNIEETYDGETFAWEVST